MKHATDIALDALEPLLRALRTHEALTERKRGVFYRRSRAFLHFHEDPAGFFADLKVEPGWVRLPVSSPAGRRALLDDVAAALDAGATRRPRITVERARPRTRRARRA